MNDEADRYREKMAKRKEIQDRKLAEATREQGLVIVNTGVGKGKTTAAIVATRRSLAVSA